MRVFLSHSSSNKKFVQEVFRQMGPANAEFDEATFAAGNFNAIAIKDAVSTPMSLLYLLPKKVLNPVTLTLKSSMPLSTLPKSKYEK